MTKAYMIKDIPVNGDITCFIVNEKKPEARRIAKEQAQKLYPGDKVVGGKDSDAFVVYRFGKYIATVAVEIV